MKRLVIILIVFLVVAAGIVYLFLPGCASHEYKGDSTDICIVIPYWKVLLFNLTGFHVGNYCRSYNEQECKEILICKPIYAAGSVCEPDKGCRPSQTIEYSGCFSRF